MVVVIESVRIDKLILGLQRPLVDQELAVKNQNLAVMPNWRVRPQRLA